jgi:hypothetical protein
MATQDRDTTTRGNPDTRTDDRADRVLPVTAEIGSEGGSYADPTYQVATFGGPLDQTEGSGGTASVATQATRGAEIAGGGLSAGPDPAEGMVRYPTESPSNPVGNPPHTDPRSGLNWRGGLIGAAAGLAGAALVGGLSRRRRPRRTEP